MGLLVSDLWVAEAVRGRGSGRRLIAAAARDGAARWGAAWLRLNVYHSNAGARRFYERLGFAQVAISELAMALDGPELRQALKDET